jgi:hypothetical protein
MCTCLLKDFNSYLVLMDSHSDLEYPIPSREELVAMQAIVAIYEKRKAFCREYMRTYRQEHKEEIKKYKKELRERHKLESPFPPRQRGRPRKTTTVEVGNN